MNGIPANDEVVDKEIESLLDHLADEPGVLARAAYESAMRGIAVLQSAEFISIPDFAFECLRTTQKLLNEEGPAIEEVAELVTTKMSPMVRAPQTATQGYVVALDNESLAAYHALQATLSQDRDDLILHTRKSLVATAGVSAHVGDETLRVGARAAERAWQKERLQQLALTQDNDEGRDRISTLAG